MIDDGCNCLDVKPVRKPMDIYKIQKALASIKDGGMMGEVIRTEANNNLFQAIEFVASQGKSNRTSMLKMISEETLTMIENWNL